MTEITCGYPNREQALISYLYEDPAGEGQSAFQQHIAGCAICQTEIAQLKGVRRQLETWQAPAVAGLASAERRAPSAESWWHDVPMWARTAAAVLCIGAGAGLANVHASYGPSGLTVSTGWIQPRGSDISNVPSASSNPVSRSELTALENQLREEIHTASASAPPPSAQPVTVASTGAPSMSDADLMRRVRAMVEDSERRQESELALRVGQVMRDVNAQRQSDLRKIDTNLGVIQNSTGAEIMRQRQMLMNSMNYIVKVSEKK